MTREQLESVIWQNMPTAWGAVSRVEAILAAADAYATYVGGITAERRAGLLPQPHTRKHRRAPALDSAQQSGALTPDKEGLCRTLPKTSCQN